MKKFKIWKVKKENKEECNEDKERPPLGSLYKFNEQPKISDELVFRKFDRIDILRRNEQRTKINLAN